MAGSTQGAISIDVEADLSKFAAQLSEDLNKALKQVKLDMSGVSKQLEEGITKGASEGTRAIDNFADRASSQYKMVGDRATEAGRRISTALKNGADGSAEGLTNIVTKSDAAASQVGRSWEKAGKSLAGVGQTMSYSMTLPLVGVGVAGVKTAADFEKAMNLVRAVSGATGDQFGMLRKEAVQLGAATQFSASQAAEAMYYLTSAGFSVQQTYDAMPSVLNLAAAGVLDLGTAADIASNVLNGFGMKAADLNHVNDVLAKTMAATAVDMRMIGDAMKYAGPIASSLHLSFEEVSAAIGLMGNAGIKGEMAGTSLRGALARLIDPPKEAAGAIDQLGIKVKDTHGQMLPLADILDQLARKGATTADVMNIFGLEAGPGMQALLGQGSTALRDLTKQLQNAGGTADTMAKIQMQGFSGSWDNLSSSIEGLTIAIGDSGVLSRLTALANKMTAWVTALSQQSPATLRAIVGLGALAAAAGPVILVTGKMVQSLGLITQAFAAMTAEGSALAAVGAFIASTVGLIVIAVVAVAGALVYAYFHVQRFRDIADTTFRAAGAAAMWLWNTAIRPASAAIVAALRVVGEWVSNLWRTSWMPALRGMGSSIANAWNTQIRPALVELGVALGQLGDRIGAWWHGGGKQAFLDAGHIVQWWYGNVLWPALKGAILLLGALGFALYWVFLNVAIPLFGTAINTIRAFTVAWQWIFAAAQPVTQFLLSAFHTIAQVITWWWTNVSMPAFQSFMAVMRAVGAVVSFLGNIAVGIFHFMAAEARVLAAVFQFMWNTSMAVFNDIAAVIQFVWNVSTAAFRLIAAGIGLVVAAVQWLWNTFSPLWIAIGQLVWAVWSGIFSVVFAILKAEFMVVAGVVVAWWYVFTSAWSAVGALVLAVWTGLILPALVAVGHVFRALWDTWIWPALSAVGQAFSWLWGQAVSIWAGIMAAVSGPVHAIGGFFSWLWGQAVSIWAAIVSAIMGAVNRIVGAGNDVAGFVRAVIGSFTSAVNGVSGKIDEMASLASSIPGRIAGAIGNLAGLLVDAGRNVINGLINGIEGRIGALRDKIASAAQTIRDALPFSPAKEGPLSGRGDPTIAGGVIVDMIATGIRSNIPALRRVSGEMAGAAAIGSGLRPAGPGTDMVVSDAFTPPASVRNAAGPVRPQVDNDHATGGGNVYYLTVNALDPRAAASAVIAAIKEYERSNGKVWRAA